MKHLSFLRRHANIVFCLLLCLVYQRAESKELFENNSLDTCYVLAIANVDLTTDLQKKYEERNIATSAIVGYSFSDDEVKIYLLDDRYDFDLYSIQKGDSITLHYPHTSQEKEKKAIAIHNHSFQERIRKNDRGGISTNVLKAKDSLVKRQPDCWIIFSGRRAHGVSMDLWKMTISTPNAYANVLVCAAKDVSKSL